MKKKTEGQIRRIFQNFSKHISDSVEEVVQEATWDTFAYIMDISPIYTGAFKSNNQILIKGLGLKPENKATSAERYMGLRAGNSGAGPLGTPVGRFPALIGAAEQAGYTRTLAFQFPESRRITFTNVSSHAEIVENKGWEVYGQAAVYFKERIRSLT